MSAIYIGGGNPVWGYVMTIGCAVSPSTAKGYTDMRCEDGILTLCESPRTPHPSPKNIRQRSMKNTEEESVSGRLLAVSALARSAWISKHGCREIVQVPCRASRAVSPSDQRMKPSRVTKGGLFWSAIANTLFPFPHHLASVSPLCFGHAAIETA
jgi:hypothetical protein